MATNKFHDAALKETDLPETLRLCLLGICLSAPENGVHKSPEHAADLYMGAPMAFPVGALFKLQKLNLLEVAVGSTFYAVLRVKAGRLKGRPLPYRPGIPTHIQREVWERDGERCAYCTSPEGPFHLDHILPWSRGGSHSVANLTVCCATCNYQKSDRTPEEMGWNHG